MGDMTYEDGVTDSRARVSDYLGSLIDSGRLDESEIRLVENILGDLEKTLDPDTF